MQEIRGNLHHEGFRRPTIKEVAEAAGVSPSTVSRVFTGSAAVSESLARRVMKAAERLQYRANPLAQSLIRGTKQSIGVVVPDLGNPYFTEIIKGIEVSARLQQYRTIVAESDEQVNLESDLIQELALWVDGLVICSPRLADSILRKLSRNLPRCILINRVVEGSKLKSITINFYEATLQILRYLWKLEHKTIAYLQGPELSWADYERQRAFKVAEKMGLRVTYVPCGWTASHGYSSIDSLNLSSVSAIVAYSDYVAIGALKRIHEIGVIVPDELSLVGFDGIGVGELTYPTLTTMKVNMFEMGKLAWDCFNKYDCIVETISTVTVRGSFEVRASSGPAIKVPLENNPRV